MRIQNLHIENFRRFSRFEMKNLGRINLIVGACNSGKTTMLEGISILMADGNPSNLWAALSRRREFVWIKIDKSANVTGKFSIVVTWRQQGINALDYLTRCYQAHLDDEPAPSLLPSASPSQAT